MPGFKDGAGLAAQNYLPIGTPNLREGDGGVYGIRRITWVEPHPNHDSFLRAPLWLALLYVCTGHPLYYSWFILDEPPSRCASIAWITSN